MTSLEKLAVYFDSFGPEDPSYDYACFLREKIASLAPEVGKHVEEHQQHEEDNDESRQVETAETDKTHENLEGKLMEPAFQDLEALNKIEAEKEKVGEIVNPVRSLLERIAKNS